MGSASGTSTTAEADSNRNRDAAARSSAAAVVRPVGSAADTDSASGVGPSDSHDATKAAVVMAATAAARTLGGKRTQ